MDHTRPPQNQLGDIIYFFLINLSILFVSIIIWHLIWIKKHGGMIPISRDSNENEILLYFHSKDFKFVIKELYKRLTQFEKNYMMNSIGMEGYLYLLYQRKIIIILTIMTIISTIVSLAITISNLKEIKESSTYTIIHDFFLNNKYMNDFSSYMHICSLIIFSFLHFRYLTIFKTESKFLYFERFDKMSRYKNYEWLRCRTLHISGIAPEERNTSLLKSKLDLYLQNNGGGKVIDINFIPDYSNILEHEIEKSEIVNFQKIINHKNESTFIKKCVYPPIYESEEMMNNELERLESNIHREILKPVFSSGHAFICFDSLMSSYTILTNFHEDIYKKIKLKWSSFWENLYKRKPLDLNQSTFGRFYDEDLHLDVMDHEKIHILVDHMIESNDVIWTNVGGDSGLFIFRRIMLNIANILILVFLTTPTALFSAIKYIDYYNFLEFQWTKDIPFGYLIKIYLPPLVIVFINTLLILAIDYSAYFEKHYTHTRCQLSILTKSLFYLLLNMLVIPGITMATKKLESIYNLMTDKNISLTELFSKIYIADYGYFFVVMIIQSGTLSGVFYLTRLGDLISNRLSSFFAFYKRYFLNIGNPWQRRDKDIFQYGYFYANMITIYTIAVIFSSTIPFICYAGLYYFIIKHIIDMICLLMVNREEMDSSGEQVNHVIKFSSVSIFIYHICMISFFILNEKYSAAIVTSFIFAICLIYMFHFHTRYIFDVYALFDKIKNYEHYSDRISVSEISKWRNKYKHPLVIPNFVELKEEVKGESNDKNRLDALSQNSFNLILSNK